MYMSFVTDCALQLKFIADSINELQRDMGSLKAELNAAQSSLAAEANDDLLAFSRKLDSFYTAKIVKLADLQVGCCYPRDTQLAIRIPASQSTHLFRTRKF